MPPKQVGPYRIVGTLGKGGIGTVYRGEDRRTGEPVAVKLLSTGPALEPTVAKRLVREFEALVGLSHPNVVRVYDAGVHQGYPYLVMELVEGLNLKRHLAMTDLELPSLALRASTDDDADEEDDEENTSPVPRFGVDELFEEPESDEYPAARRTRGSKALRAYADATEEPDTEITIVQRDPRSRDRERGELPFEDPRDASVDALPASFTPDEDADLDELNRPERVGRLKDALLQLCEALGYIHGHGLIHRDLKPSNILVDEDRRVRLMDFGLAKHLAEESAVTGHGRIVGTYRYMAPEQAMGERVDHRSDLYSLGVLIYELLAGRPPYDSDNPMELWQQVLESDPPSLFEVNPQVDDVLARVAHKLLRKDPYERYQTAEEVFEVLISG